MGNPETDIKNRGLGELNRVGVFWNHPSGEGIPPESVKQLLKQCAPYVPFDIWTEFSRLSRIKYGKTGSSDIVGVIPVIITPEMVGRTIGMATFVEFKTDTGRQRDKQKSFQALVESVGAPYVIERDHVGIVSRVVAKVYEMIGVNPADAPAVTAVVTAPAKGRK